MKCPSLDELPRAPLNKEGWPWDQESKNVAEEPTPCLDLPSISIITPNFNQAKYIEETIRSVLLQGYPCIEYIIIDGGSTDGSLEIIKKYEKWLTYWTSVPDTGQSNAINKGFLKATGSITAWLNSDDIYEIESLNKVGAMFASRNDVDIIYGDGMVIDEKGAFLGIGKSRLINDHDDLGNFIPNRIFQPSLFFRRKILDEIGFLDENLHYAMDVDFWIRAFSKHNSFYTEKSFAQFRLHKASKTTSSSLNFILDELILISRYSGSQKLFNHSLESYISGSSRSNNVPCELTYENTIIDLKKLGVTSQYINQTREENNYTIAMSYLLNADYFYTISNLSKSRKSLIYACWSFPLIMKKLRFWHLCFTSLLPRIILKYLRYIYR
jgi:glycosyltransferase involved in cell wall biosynthesis